MKKLTISLMAVLIAFSLFTSCNSGANVEKDIVGKWTIETSNLENLDELVTEMASQLDLNDSLINQMKEELESEMGEDMKGTYIEFNEDHTVNLDEDQQGSWSYDKENNKIVIKDDDGTYDLFINSLKGDDLDATFVISDNGMNFRLKVALKRE